MRQRSFLTSLLLVSVGTTIFIFLLTSLPQFHSSAAISWISFLIFAAISILMYFWGYKSATSKDKNALTRVVIVSIMLKIVVALIIVIVYIEVVKAESRLFVYPFLVIYFIYTIFETHFMMKLGKMES